jgi:hypothetical protein
MVQQARKYFVGAMSGATLIGIAIAVFVVLVSAQVFHDFPLGALIGHSDNDAVAPAKALATGGNAGANAAVGGTLGKANRAATPTAAPVAVKTGGKAGAHHRPANAAVAEANPTAAGDEVGGGPSTETTAPSTAGTETSPSESGSTSSSGSTGSPTSSSSGSNSSSSSSSATSTPTTSTAKKPPSEPESAEPSTGGGLDEGVVGTVNNTVGTVDEATGGALTETGVAGTVETVVNGLAGPETVVGKTVNGVGEVVGGLLGGKKSE